MHTQIIYTVLRLCSRRQGSFRFRDDDFTGFVSDELSSGPSEEDVDSDDSFSNRKCVDLCVWLCECVCECGCKLIK